MGAEFGGAPSGASAPLATTVYDPVADATFVIAGAALADVDAANLKLPDFVAPASGRALFVASLWADLTSPASTTVLKLGVRDAVGDVAGSDVRAMLGLSGAAQQFDRLSVRVPIVGLVAGATIAGWKLSAARSTGAGVINLYAGPTFGPAVLEVWPLA